jgi:hypothetical protein
VDSQAYLSGVVSLGGLSGSAIVIQSDRGTNVKHVDTCSNQLELDDLKVAAYQHPKQRA